MSATIEQPGRATRVRLGDVLRLRKEIVHPRDNPSGPAVFVGLEHIESGTGRRIGQLEVEKSSLTGRKPVFKKGDIVYGYLRPYLNKVWLADFDGLCSVDQYVYSVDPEKADPRFVAWFMRSPVFLARAPISSTPGQLPRIRTEEVAAVPIDLPEIREQRRIADELDEQMAVVERARVAAEARLQAARALFDSRVREIFESNEAARWDRCPLSGVLRGHGQYGLSVKTHANGKGLPVLRMGNLSNGEIDWSDLKYLELPDSEAAKYRLSEGDLVFNRTNSAERVGKTAVFAGHREALFASYLIRFRLKPEVADPDFVSTYINSRGGRAYVREKMTRAIGQVNISASQMAKMPIPLPGIERQREIAAELQTYRLRSKDLVAQIETESAQFRDLPSVVLRRAFAGEL